MLKVEKDLEIQKECGGGVWVVVDTEKDEIVSYGWDTQEQAQKDLELTEWERSNTYREYNCEGSMI